MVQGIENFPAFIVYVLTGNSLLPSSGYHVGSVIFLCHKGGIQRAVNQRNVSMLSAFKAGPLGTCILQLFCHIMALVCRIVVSGTFVCKHKSVSGTQVSIGTFVWLAHKCFGTAAGSTNIPFLYQKFLTVSSWLISDVWRKLCRLPRPTAPKRRNKQQ